MTRRFVLCDNNFKLKTQHFYIISRLYLHRLTDMTNKLSLKSKFDFQYIKNYLLMF
jgi:hypothetical protein